MEVSVEPPLIRCFRSVTAALSRQPPSNRIYRSSLSILENIRCGTGDFRAGYITPKYFPYSTCVVRSRDAREWHEAGREMARRWGSHQEHEQVEVVQVRDDGRVSKPMRGTPERVSDLDPAVPYDLPP